MTVVTSSVASADGTAITVLTVGSGPGLIVVGGVLQAAEDYLGLADELAASFTVHVVNRRGRAGSGPYGGHYGLVREREDLAAVQQATGSLRVFGHSYGGLIVLESLAHSDTPIVAASVYEPGVSIAGSIPTAWIPRYRQFLADADPYAAFAHFIGSNPQAPAAARAAPQGYLRTILRLMPGFKERILPYLEGNALEHEVIARHGGLLADYARIAQPVQLLVGSKSPESCGGPKPPSTTSYRRPVWKCFPGLSIEHHWPSARANWPRRSRPG